ncbi:MAG: PAS domain S-box protein [Chloroflexi bacterium]|nr:PAS domain S-box protein [Chloroflexota bacterium]
MDVFFLSLIPALALILYLFLILVTWRHGIEDKLNQRFILYLLSMMVWSLGALMMYLDRPRAPAWNRLMIFGVVVMPLVFFSFVQAFRRERTHDKVLQLGMAACVVFLVATARGSMAGDIHITDRGLILFSLGPAIPYFGIYFGVLLGLSALSLVQGIRNTKDHVQRNRYVYVFLGLGLILVGGITNTTGELGAYPLDISANTMNAIILAYTIFRYQLLDISLVVRKGLLYTVPTVVIGVGYLLIIFLSVNLFDIVSGYQTLLLSVIVATAVALIMQPVQEKLQSWIDRMFFREKYNANLMLQRVSRTASSILHLDRLADMMLNEVTSTIHIAKAALFLSDQATGTFELVAQRGLPPETSITLRQDHPVIEHLATVREVQTMFDVEMTPQFKALWAQERRDLKSLAVVFFVPLLAQRDLIGMLVVGPKLSEGTYTLDEQLILSTLANQTAIAVQNAWLYQRAIEEKQRAEVILEQAFTGIVLVDGDLDIVDMNPAATRITGFAREALLGDTILRMFAGELWDEDGALRHAIETKQSLHPTETVLVGREGRRDVLLGVTPVQDRYLFNFTDITKLKEVGRLQSNIVANVSHELRTPLASIKGYADLLLHGDDRLDDELRQQCLTIIDSEADRMNRVINTLLDLSKLESGRDVLPMDTVYIPEIIEETVKALSVQADKAGISLLWDASSHLPPLTANRDMLASILKNLIGNAIKFSVQGGEVRVVAKVQADWLNLQVIDHGLGIPAEDIPHLFTKFYRSKRAHDAGVRGTGLGLALVKEAVEVHKGEIAVESVEGVGTRITVTLPLHPDVVSDNRATQHTLTSA